jgi:hypothetical protein
MLITFQAKHELLKKFFGLCIETQTKRRFFSQRDKR